MGYLSIHYYMVISASLNVFMGSGGDVWAMDYSSSVEQNRKINDFCLLRSSSTDLIESEA